MRKKFLIFAVGFFTLNLTACLGGGGGGSRSASDTTNRNAAPIATNLTVVGNAKLGETLTGSYTYSDAEGDAEGVTQFKWYRGSTIIPNATSAKYVVTDDDTSQQLIFEVTPVAATGTITGTAVKSSAVQIARAPLNPKDPNYLANDQWYIKNPGSAPGNWTQFKTLESGADLRVEPVWGEGITGNSITVAVFDDGIDFNNPDLKNQELKTGGRTHSYDFSTDSQTAQPDGAASSGQNDHGTACAGIIAAQSNAIGTVGIAPEAKLIGYKILAGSKSNKDPYLMLLESDTGAQVSNHSYGAADDGALHSISTEFYNSIKNLVVNGGQNGKGHAFLFAAGNGRVNNLRALDIAVINSRFLSGSAETVINYGDYAGYDIAQQHPYVYSISGFNAEDKEVSYAEDGPGTLVAAPTGDAQANTVFVRNSRASGYIKIIENSPKQPTANIATTGRVDYDYATVSNNTAHRTDTVAGVTLAFNGTSAATPAAAGVVALIRAANPNLTWRDVRWVMAKTARKIQGGGDGETSGVYIDGSDAKPPAVGSALAVPYWSEEGNSTMGRWSHAFGFGALNAEAAVSEAKNFTSLAKMQTCELSGSDINTSVSSHLVDVTFQNKTFSATACPNVVEFIQVNYTISAGAINDLELSMNLSKKDGSAYAKDVRFLRKTTCSNNSGCNLTAATTIPYAGTVAYLGDEVSKQSVISFSSNNDNRFTINKVTIFGFLK